MLAKYQERRFVAMHATDLAQLPGSSLQDALWTAVVQGNLQLAMRCFVGGADLQHRCFAEVLRVTRAVPEQRTILPGTHTVLWPSSLFARAGTGISS